MQRLASGVAGRRQSGRLGIEEAPWEIRPKLGLFAESSCDPARMTSVRTETGLQTRKRLGSSRADCRQAGRIVNRGRAASSAELKIRDGPPGPLLTWPSFLAGDIGLASG